MTFSLAGLKYKQIFVEVVNFIDLAGRKIRISCGLMMNYKEIVIVFED